MDFFRSVKAILTCVVIAAQAKQNIREGGSAGGKALLKRTNPLTPIDTREVIADTAGLSPATIYRVKKVQQEGTPEVKEVGIDPPHTGL